ncbi:MAG: metallophosphoesterase [Tannerellaceae bacterium]
MNQYKIAHIADLHLRDSQYGFSSRSAQFYTSAMEALKTAIDNGADTILLSGDIVDSVRPSSGVVHQLRAMHTWLVQKKVRALFIPGNHDASTPHWAEIVRNDDDIYGFTPIYDRGVYTIPDSKITVYGTHFMSPPEFRANVASMPEADIFMWHATLSEFPGYHVDGTLSMSDVPEHKYKVVALGDLHISDARRRVTDDTIFAYPGSTEMCSSSESLQKNIIMYKFSGGYVEYEFIPFATTPILVGTADNEAELDELITAVEVNKDKLKIVLVKYNMRLSELGRNVRDELTRALPKAIIRVTPYSELVKLNEVSKLQDMSDITLASVLLTLVTGDDPVHELCAALIDPAASTEDVFNAWWLKYNTTTV